MLMFIVTSGAPAQDLVSPQRNPALWRLYIDTQAREIGDVLTIVISENTDVDNKDERALNKDTEAKGLFNFNTDANGQTSSVKVDGTTTSSRKFDGKSEYTVERGFSDRISVAVLDVQPNGNLVVGGKRQHFVAGEVRTLAISGVVRMNDIRPDNSVESRFVSHLQMNYVGKGPESEFSNQGWLGRVVNKVWPF
jgi:flagellar L-ring protein precursor FlgH